MFIDPSMLFVAYCGLELLKLVYYSHLYVVFETCGLYGYIYFARDVDPHPRVSRNLKYVYICFIRSTRTPSLRLKVQCPAQAGMNWGLGLADPGLFSVRGRLSPLTTYYNLDIDTSYSSIG